MMRAPDNRRLSKALALFDPPPAHRDRVTKNIQAMLDLLADYDEGLVDEDLPFERDRAGLTRYINALRELKASHAALDPSLRTLTLGKETVTLPFLGEMSAIEAEIREAETMLEMCRRPGGQPTNERARTAVRFAGMLLAGERHKLTTERKGKWHLLSQIFADTDRDLRHHLTYVLAETERKMSEADDEVASLWRKTQKR